MLNLGSLEFTLGVNTRALDSAISRIEKFGNTVQQVQTKANRGADTQIAQYRKVENAILKSIDSIAAAASKIQGMKITPETKTEAITLLNNRFNELSKNIANTGKVADNTKLDRNVASFRNQVANLIREVQALATEQKNMASAANTADIAMGKQANALFNAAERAKNLEAQIERVSTEFSAMGAQAAAGLASSIDPLLAKLKTSLTGAEPLKPAQFREAVQQYKAGMNEINRGFQALKAREMKPDFQSWRLFRDNLRGVGDVMLLLNGHLGGMSTRMFALGGILRQFNLAMGLTIAGVAGMSAAIYGLVSGTLKAALTMNQVRYGLNSITASAVETESQLNFVRKVADQSGQSFKELGEDYAKYLAAARSAGQTYDETQRQFKLIAAAAGQLHLSVENTQGVLIALEQMFSKGRVQSEELRKQLGNQLPGAFQIAAKAMGVTTQQLDEMLRKGLVPATEFIPKFVDALKKTYNINENLPIDTLNAAINRAKTASLAFFDTVGKNTAIVNLAKDALTAFTNTLNSLANNMPEIVLWTKRITEGIIALTAAWVAWKAITLINSTWLLIANGFNLMWGAIVQFTTAIREATAALIAFDAVAAASPVGRLGGLLLKLATIAGIAWGAYKLLNGVMGESNTQAADISGIQKYIDAQIEMGFQVRATTKDIYGRIDAILKEQQVTYAAARSNFQNIQRRGVSTSDQVIGAAMHPFDRGAAMNSAWLNYLRRALEAQQEMRDAEGNLKNTMLTLEKWQVLHNLPLESAKTQLFEPKAGKEGKGAHGEGQYNDVLKLITAYDELKSKLAALDFGPKFIEHFEYVKEATDKVNALFNARNKNQIGQVDQALTAAGFGRELGSGESLKQNLIDRMALLIEKTKSAKDAMDDWAKSWEAIDKLGPALDDVNSRIDYFQHGLKTTGEYQFDNIQKATDMLYNMGLAGKDAQPEIDSLIKKIEALPYGLQASSQDLKGLIQLLADLFNVVDAAKIHEDALKGMNESIKSIQDSARQSAVELVGMAKGLRDLDLQNFVQAGQIVADWNEQLGRGEISAEDLRLKVLALNGAMADLAPIEAMKQKMQNFLTFSDSVAQAIADSTGQLVTSFGNIYDTAKQLLNRLTSLFVNQLIVQPIFDSLKKKMPQLLGSFAPHLDKTALATAQAGTVLSGSGAILKTAATELTTAGTLWSQVATQIQVAAQALAASGGGKAGGGGGGLGGLGGLFSKAFPEGIFGITTASAGLQADVASTIASNLAIFKDGGYVRGPGSSTSDSIDAKVSNGEFIFSAEAVRRWGVSTLMAMNDNARAATGNAGPKKFANGGYISGRQQEAPTMGGDMHFYFPNVRNKYEAREAAGEVSRTLRKSMVGPIRNVP